MKIFIFVISILLFTVNSHAAISTIGDSDWADLGEWSGQAKTSLAQWMGQDVPSDAECSDPCSGCLVSENFESSYDWTEYVPSGCIIDEDYTTGPLELTTSLRLVNCNTEGSYTYKVLPAPESELYVAFSMKLLQSAPGENDSDILNSADDIPPTQLVALTMDTDRTIQINWMAQGSSSNSSTSLTIGTTYFIWLYLKKGTGANAEYWVRIGTSEVYSESTQEISGSNGAWTTDRAAIYPASQHNATTYEILYDQFSVDDTAIGDLCPAN